MKYLYLSINHILMSICQFSNWMCLWEVLRVTIGACVFYADGIMITNNINNNYVFLNVLNVSNYEYDLNKHKSLKRNFPPLRFSCLYGLKVSEPEIRHLPANHPKTILQPVNRRLCDISSDSNKFCTSTILQWNAWKEAGYNHNSS